MTSFTGYRRDARSGARTFASLLGAVILLGTADSMAGSYLVLFASEHARLTAVQVGVFASAPGIGGLVLSTLAGRRFDTRPTRFYATAAAVASAVGFVLLAATTSFPLLLLIAATLLAAQRVAFPQLFSLARVMLGSDTAGNRSTPLLRSGWSLAWAIGPLAGSALLPSVGFTGLLLAAAGVLAVTALVAVSIPSPRGAGGKPSEPEQQADATEEGAGREPRLRLALLVTGVGLFFLAMFAGSVALPLYVTRGLRQPDSLIGLLYSVCAAVEVVIALALARLPQRVSQALLITVGMTMLAVYFVVTTLASDIVLLVVGQIVRGTAIAVVGAAGIRFFQDLMAPRAGRATTLFSNATTAGSLLAGVLAGLAIHLWGYTATLMLCGGCSLLATAAFSVGAAPRIALGSGWVLSGVGALRDRRPAGRRR